MYTQRKADFATATKKRYSDDIVDVVVVIDSQDFWRLRLQLQLLLSFCYFVSYDEIHERIETYIVLEWFESHQKIKFHEGVIILM